MLLIFLSLARVVRGNAGGSSRGIGDVTLRGAGELGGSPCTQPPPLPPARPPASPPLGTCPDPLLLDSSSALDGTTSHVSTWSLSYCLKRLDQPQKVWGRLPWGGSVSDKTFIMLSQLPSCGFHPQRGSKEKGTSLFRVK